MSGNGPPAAEALVDFPSLYERVRSAGAGALMAAAGELACGSSALASFLHSHGGLWERPGSPPAHLRLLASAWAWRGDLPLRGLEEWLASAGPDGPWLRALDGPAATGAAKLPRTGHGRRGLEVAVDPGGRWIASACAESLRQFSLLDGRCLLVRRRAVPRERSNGLHLRLRPGFPHALWVRGAHIQLWDLDTGTLRGELSCPLMPEWMWFLGADRLLVADARRALVVEAETGRPIGGWDWGRPRVTEAFPLMGGALAVGFDAWGRRATVHDVPSGRPIPDQPPALDSWQLWPAPDGRRVAAARREGDDSYFIDVWDFAAGRKLATTRCLRGSFGNGAAYSLDGNVLWFGSRRLDLAAGTLDVWRVADGMAPIAALPDERLLGHRDGETAIYDLRTGDLVASFAAGSTGAIDLPDGRVVPFGHGRVHLWDPTATPRVAAPRVKPRPERQEGDEVLVLRPDGSRMVARFDRSVTRVMGETDVSETLDLYMTDPSGAVRGRIALPPDWRLETDGRYVAVPSPDPDDDRSFRVVAVDSFAGAASEALALWELDSAVAAVRCAGDRVEAETTDGRVMRFELMPAGPWTESGPRSG